MLLTFTPARRVHRAAWLIATLAMFGCRAPSNVQATATAPSSTTATTVSSTDAPGSNIESSPANSSATVSGRRNVILMLSDGTTPEAWTLARWVKGNSLHVDRILTGAVRTYGADSIITDSAPGATAYATGRKGSDKGIAVGAWHNTIAAAKTDPKLAYVPLATLLEGAKIHGYATGLIATSNIQHATPAAFSAHVPDRKQYNEIAEQQIYQGIDVVLSGGAKYLLPNSVPGGARTDGEDLVQVIRSSGYRYVTTKSEMLASKEGRIWAAFAPDDMAYEIDRSRFAPNEPALSEMTEYAITNLSHSERGKRKGLFVFIEGSKVDWAAHNNDPVGTISDLLAFDEAVGVALRFAESNTDTQVIVVADHGTGGMTIGSSVDANYSQTDDDTVVGPLRRAKVSAERLGKLLVSNRKPFGSAPILQTEWGLGGLTPQQSSALASAIEQPSTLAVHLGRLISARALIGWTTTGHNGADVMLYAYGPEHPKGLVENTAVGDGIAQYLGLDFEQLQRRLYVNAAEELAPRGYTVTHDRRDPNNGVLVVSKDGVAVSLPWAKNLLVSKQDTVTLDGIVVYAEKLDRTFVPRQAIDWILRMLP